MRSLDSTKTLFVWHPELVGNGSLNANIFLCRASGCNALLFKHDDGGAPFVDKSSTFGVYPEKIIKWRDVCRKQGIAFGLWGYHYGHRLAEERAMVRRAAYLSPDFYVVDWEIEFEKALFGQADKLRDHLKQMARDRPLSMGLFHSPLAQPQHHQPWQYQMFNEFFNGMMPQIYHGAMQLPYDEALRRSYDDYAEYGLDTVPIYPAGQAYAPVTPEGIVAWAEMAQRVYGAKGLSWWSAEHLTPALAAGIRQVTLEVPVRRVNGQHPDYPASKRVVMSPGTHTIPIREPFSLLASDRRVVLDLEFAPIPGAPVPVIIVKDGDGKFAGYVDSTGWRKSVPVYMDATPQGNIRIEVLNIAARVVLVGILEAGG